MNQVKTIFFASRPSFLILSLSIVLLAASVAHYDGAIMSSPLFFLTLLGAVLAHAAVNLLNEYQDHLSGLDFMTQKTPFSGGSGSLQQSPEVAKTVFMTVKMILLVLVLLGGYFIYAIGWQLLPLGLLGIGMIMLYTSVITKRPWLCLIFPGLAFGPVMLLSCYFIFSGQFSWLVLALSLIPFFLVNNLLLLNQVPDIDADKKVGRFNVLMKLGIPA